MPAYGEIVAKCLGALENDTSVRRATVYVAPALTVKATRQHRFNARQRAETFIVSVGRPNYRERVWIKAALKAGEPFPVRKPQLDFWPVKRG